MKKHKVLSVILYLLPILFFIISYFLITTSGEDIWQGANNFRTDTTIDVISDATNAFNFNSRITDMYAWSVIDFYDYQFQFGPDLIFRLVDVTAVILTFYLATYIILGRKPKLQIKDSLTFCACFITIILTTFGRPLYHEFSMIHNYVPLILATLLFSIPYLNLIRKNPPKKHLTLLALGMLLLGLYFGMAATITPIAFLATVIIYCLIKRKSLTRPPIWFFTGIIGTIAGFAICWFAGSGIDHYTNPATAATFDYISISSIFSAPATAIPGILFHEVYNFGTALAPLLVITVIAIVFSNHRRSFFTKKFYRTLSPNLKNYLLVFSLFIVIHLLGASLVKAPPRLILPAYFAGVIIVLHFFVPHLNSKLIGTAIATITALVLIAHATFRLIYHRDMSILLDEVRNSSESSLCFDHSRVDPPRLRFIDLSQANILVDWGTPEKIYGKEVTFCK